MSGDMNRWEALVMVAFFATVVAIGAIGVIHDIYVAPDCVEMEDTP